MGLEPQLVRRHVPGRVLVEQRGECVHVVSLEGVDVPLEQGLLRAGRASPAGPRHAQASAASVARARCSALFTDATVVSSNSATSLGVPVQHLAQDQHRALAGRQALERGDSASRTDSRASATSAGSPPMGTTRRIGHGLDPGGSGRRSPAAVPCACRRPRGPSAGRDAGWRRACRGTRWSRCGRARTGARPGPRSGRSAPRAQHRLLDGVLRLERRAQHPIAVGGGRRR